MADDLPGLPAAAAERWLRSALPALVQDGPWHAEVISGGLSNITYRLRLPGGTVILRRPPALAAPRDHQRFEKRPFLIRHQAANQDRLPKSSLESRFAIHVNQLCQQDLDHDAAFPCGTD